MNVAAIATRSIAFTRAGGSVGGPAATYAPVPASAVLMAVSYLASHSKSYSERTEWSRVPASSLREETPSFWKRSGVRLLR
ncbi:hypothetical protein [Streptomyces sp. NPDC002676]